MSNILADNLSSVLDVFAPGLKSVDIRTVAVKPTSANDAWTNLITSIFVSAKSTEEVETEHKVSVPQVKNDRFAVFLKTTPFGKSIFDEILQGTIKFASGSEIETVSCRQLPLLTLRVNTSPLNIRGVQKSSLRLIVSDTSPMRSKLWEAVNNQYLEARRLHYNDVVALIKDAVDTDYIGSGENRDFEVAITPSAKIVSVSFAGPICKVKVSGISGLKNLQLNFALGRPNYYYEPPWRGEVRLDDVKPLNTNTDSLEVEVKPSNILPNDQMYVELIQRDVPLNISCVVAEVPLENTVEPFLNTLTAFCSLEDFKKMLFEPYYYGKKPQKVFEYAVNWLFSLAGFQTIYLGFEIDMPNGKKKNFDSLVAKESGVPIGCADILAYEESKRLLLIDCDTGSAHDEKINRLIETKNYLESSHKFSGFSFVPVLCTPKQSSNVTNNGVLIADRNVIADALNQIAKGNRQAARDKLLGKVGWLMGE